MKNAFDDPKILSKILREQERSALARVALDTLAEQRSAAARVALDRLAEQKSAAARVALDTITEQKYAAARIGLDTLAEQRSGITKLAADMFAVRSLGTGVHISDALAAATLANTSLSQMIHDASGTFDWKGLVGGVSKDWLREMKLANSGMLTATTGVALKSHLINIADLSSQAEALVSSLLPNRLGLALSISDEAKIGLTGTFVDFSHSYRSLVESFQTSPASLLSLSPRLSRLPAVEYYNGAILSRSISVQEDNEEAAYSQNEIATETGDALDGFLVRLNPKLVHIRDGARKALNSRNPDRVRHFSSSYRELLTHVLHALAPDDGIREWSASPEHYHNRRPTRRARLLYISRRINQKPFETFVDNDIDAVLEYFELLHGGTHGVDSSYTPVQLKALQIRIEGAIRFLFEISQSE